ncbi:MAG: diheme cytochrome c [Magnetococcales bacterium]|nr:diheme cytochrome c [Magnetococcales bacterium]
MHNFHKGWMVALLVTGGIGGLTEAWGSDRSEYRSVPARATPEERKLYKSECGSCHMAYPPGLLPARGWEKLMGGLEHHFGDNAELDVATAENLKRFLSAHAAERAEGKLARKVLASIAGGDAPTRISQVGYFLKEHRKIPEKIIKSPEVASLSRCENCHARAEEGMFDEGEIRVPGLGVWKD